MVEFTASSRHYREKMTAPGRGISNSSSFSAAWFTRNASLSFHYTWLPLASRTSRLPGHILSSV
jgi:hypothetical protein